MKHKTNVGPGLIVALGSPGGGSTTGDRATGGGVSDTGDRTTGDRGSLNALSNATNIDTVPLDMLSMPDDQEKMQSPEVGDVVNYQVTGKVVAIEGNNAKVQRQSINGQELPGGNEQDEDASSQDSDAASSGGTTGDSHEAAGLRNQAAGIGMLS